MWLHSDSRFTRIFKSMHFSRRRFRKHFAHRGSDAVRLAAVASWLFQRPRPYVQTDGAVLSGLLDPQNISSEQALIEEIVDLAGGLSHGVFLLSPDSAAEGSGGKVLPAESLAGALLEQNAGVECSRIASASSLPHEVAISGVQWALEQWLLTGKAQDSHEA